MTDMFREEEELSRVTDIGLFAEEEDLSKVTDIFAEAGLSGVTVILPRQSKRRV